uniref:Transthyretin-like family protein n=1 Tax=Romanomermis culicivorax TaxID=13658 RepID=A0A915HVQ8_ROMCU
MSSNQICVVLALLAITVADANLFGRRQRVMAKGRLMCGSVPATNVLVKLMDEDDLGIDDKMAEQRTDRYGYFYLDGEESEVTPVDPKLEIFHDCNDFWICQRMWTLKIPDKYINSNEPIDIGEVNLEMQLKGEKRSCWYKKK